VQGVVRNVQAFLMAGVKVQAGKQTVFTDSRGVYRITAHEGEQLRFSLKGYRTETLVLRKGGIFDVELSAETP
jgi:periplasmic beta-glucosidase